MQSNDKLRTELLAILYLFRQHTRNVYFCTFLIPYRNWLLTLNSDADFYDPFNIERVTDLKNFLKDPDAIIPQYNFDTCNDHLRMKEAFIQKQTGGSFRFTTMEEAYAISSADFFTEIVTELEDILMRVPPNDYENMREKNREFYHELNKVVLKPERVEKISRRFGLEFFDYLDVIIAND